MGFCKVGCSRLESDIFMIAGFPIAGTTVDKYVRGLGVPDYVENCEGLYDWLDGRIMWDWMKVFEKVEVGPPTNESFSEFMKENKNNVYLRDLIGRHYCNDC